MAFGSIYLKEHESINKYWRPSAGFDRAIFAAITIRLRLIVRSEKQSFTNNVNALAATVSNWVGPIIGLTHVDAIGY